MKHAKKAKEVTSVEHEQAEIVWSRWCSKHSSSRVSTIQSSIPFVVAPPLSSIVLLSVRYVHETAKQSENWISIAKGATSLDDLKEAITKHLLTSNLDQHQVFMTIEYLSDIMTKQSIDYQSGTSKIDDEFNKWTLTETQNELLSTYLSSVYMSEMDAETERKFGVKYNIN